MGCPYAGMHLYVDSDACVHVYSTCIYFRSIYTCVYTVLGTRKYVCIHLAPAHVADVGDVAAGRQHLLLAPLPAHLQQRQQVVVRAASFKRQAEGRVMWRSEAAAWMSSVTCVAGVVYRRRLCGSGARLTERQVKASYQEVLSLSRCRRIRGRSGGDAGVAAGARQRCAPDTRVEGNGEAEPQRVMIGKVRGGKHTQQVFSELQATVLTSFGSGERL
jgi:hypothetical protein